MRDGSKFFGKSRFIKLAKVDIRQRNRCRGIAGRGLHRILQYGKRLGRLAPAQIVLGDIQSQITKGGIQRQHALLVFKRLVRAFCFFLENGLHVAGMRFGCFFRPLGKLKGDGVSEAIGNLKVGLGACG